jgi:membrane-bound lytic murein transglycosylase F
MTFTRLLAAFALLVSLAACGVGEPVDRDFPDIVESDTLRVVTMFNSTSYFIYRGDNLGFEYELLRAFANDNDLVLQLHVAETRGEMTEMLADGYGDIAAARIIPARARSERITFTRPLYQTQPVLVQRTGAPLHLPASVDPLLTLDTLTGPYQAPTGITTVADLAGRQVHVIERNSHYVEHLGAVSDEIQGRINVVEESREVNYEALVRQVARGQIELAVTQQNLAAISSAYYSNVEAELAVGPEHDVTLAVRDNAPLLLDELNLWLTQREADGTLSALYNKYFVDRRGYHSRIDSEYLTSETGRLSPFDELLRQYAEDIGWDWRLLASLCFQESRFDPNARSWAGATGLIQLMPATAREYGVTNLRDPEDNVRGGTAFLAWLEDYWQDHIADDEQRLKFVLASYNTGHGHVGDARRLAEYHGDDPDLWEDVAFWLLRKSQRQWFTHHVVRHGYSRGSEPVAYVQKILERFDHYQQFVQRT